MKKKIVLEEDGSPQENVNPGQRTGEGADSVWDPLTQDAQRHFRVESAAPLARASFTVLVVDDNQAARYAMARCLESAGYKTIQAAGGAEALEYAGNVAAVVLDVHLPDVHGLEVCRLLRQSAKTMFPIIHVSAVYTAEESRKQGTAAGADEYLVSPVDPYLLVDTVDALIAQYALRLRSR